MELKDKIENFIKEAAVNAGTETRYREPLVATLQPSTQFLRK